jgi:hypothetical protein
VLPSYLEGLPTALMEAMVYKVPSLTSDIPSHKEVITDGENGFLFPYDSFDALCSRLKEIIIMQEQHLSIVGNKAQAKICQEYNLDDKVRVIDKIYHSILPPKRFPSGKICFVCNSGGHLYQLYLLKPFWQKYDRFWVTFNRVDAKSRLRYERTYWAYFPTTRNLKNFLLNFLPAFQVLKKEQPAVIISNGSGVAVPFFLLGKFIFKCKLIYIEVFDRINMPTLSGKIIYRLNLYDEFILQWQEQKKFYPKGKVLGQML